MKLTTDPYSNLLKIQNMDLGVKTVSKCVLIGKTWTLVNHFQILSNMCPIKLNGEILYCAFDIFQKVVFCLTLYTEEVNLQTFVMI